MLLHLAYEPMGFPFAWKVNPDHALQVANTYPSLAINLVRLNNMNVLAAKQYGP